MARTLKRVEYLRKKIDAFTAKQVGPTTAKLILNGDFEDALKELTTSRSGSEEHKKKYVAKMKSSEYGKLLTELLTYDLNVRNLNPGNIKNTPKSQQSPWNNSIPNKGTFVLFKTADAGLRALGIVMLRNIHETSNPEEFVARYATEQWEKEHFTKTGTRKDNLVNYAERIRKALGLDTVTSNWPVNIDTTKLAESIVTSEGEDLNIPASDYKKADKIANDYVVKKDKKLLVREREKRLIKQEDSRDLDEGINDDLAPSWKPDEVETQGDRLAAIDLDINAEDANNWLNSLNGGGQENYQQQGLRTVY